MSEMKKMRPYIACVTPMSRTRPALPWKDASSSAGRPKSLTSSAPDTLKRSTMMVFMSAVRSYLSRMMVCRRRPSHRAGRANSGRRIERHQRELPRQDEHGGQHQRDADEVADHGGEHVGEGLLRAETSLFSRLTRAPVCARVKNEMGWRCT